MAGASLAGLLLVFLGCLDAAARAAPARFRAGGSRGSYLAGAELQDTLLRCGYRPRYRFSQSAYTLNKYQPATVPVQAIHSGGDLLSSATTTFEPNPAVAQLQPMGPTAQADTEEAEAAPKCPKAQPRRPRRRIQRSPTLRHPPPPAAPPKPLIEAADRNR